MNKFALTNKRKKYVKPTFKVETIIIEYSIAASSFWTNELILNNSGIGSVRIDEVVNSNTEC